MLTRWLEDDIHLERKPQKYLPRFHYLVNNKTCSRFQRGKSWQDRRPNLLSQELSNGTEQKDKQHEKNQTKLYSCKPIPLTRCTINAKWKFCENWRPTKWSICLQWNSSRGSSRTAMRTLSTGWERKKKNNRKSLSQRSEIALLSHLQVLSHKIPVVQPPSMATRPHSCR